ncbi:MAG TPA: endolytic transglycosylase MltG, partial [Candidatus Saccharimonadales bacterium]|nr:endolytic transglycosylase MltG [Candidatus Saccharimonadales bacterium]
LDSLYNTRLYKGLPPGPIASPSEYALKAAANPASTDYLYFIAGDEGGGAMYFSKTEAEHEQNIKDHCQVLCGTV